jgi:hypothetical protein
MKENILKVHVQRILYVGFFCVNDNNDVDMKCPQTMRCIICYDNPIYFVTYNLKKQIVYVKDEGSNLNTRTFALKEVVSCDILGLEESYQGTCFGHAFLKAGQHATTIDKYK